MNILMFVCTMVLYKYPETNRNDVLNMSGDMHVRIKIYQEFYHCMIYIANEGRYVNKYRSFYYIILSNIFN